MYNCTCTYILYKISFKYYSQSRECRKCFCASTLKFVQLMYRIHSINATFMYIYNVVYAFDTLFVDNEMKMKNQLHLQQIECDVHIYRESLMN